MYFEILWVCFNWNILCFLNDRIEHNSNEKQTKGGRGRGHANTGRQTEEEMTEYIAIQVKQCNRSNDLIIWWLSSVCSASHLIQRSGQVTAWKSLQIGKMPQHSYRRAQAALYKQLLVEKSLKATEVATRSRHKCTSNATYCSVSYGPELSDPKHGRPETATSQKTCANSCKVCLFSLNFLSWSLFQCSLGSDRSRSAGDSGRWRADAINILHVMQDWLEFHPFLPVCMYVWMNERTNETLTCKNLYVWMNKYGNRSLESRQERRIDYRREILRRKRKAMCVAAHHISSLSSDMYKEFPFIY